MEEVLRFLSAYEEVIYLVLGALTIWELRKFVLAWEELRAAAFGLERENAQARLNSAAVRIVLILATAMLEFSVVSFIVPTVPGAMPLVTPTIDLLATPSVTLPPTTPNPGALETPTAVAQSSAVTAASSGCIPDQLMIASPANGEQVSGRITLIGTVDEPNLGFYKYEVKYPADLIWLTIQAGRGAKRNEPLGEWDTRTLLPGDYLLQLVAVDNAGNTLGACEIQVRVVAVTQP
jgi:hypothetical protein